MKLFNIYYMNYDKAFELSMLIDNRLKESSCVTKENNLVFKGNGSLNTDKISKIPFLDKIVPKTDIEVNAEGNRVKNIVDNFKFVSTKSTILENIYKKSVEIRKLNDNNIGTLIKIRNTKLNIDNSSDILATKSLLSGVLTEIPIEGGNGIDLTQFCEVLLKDSAYTFNGVFGEERIVFKIPMKLENELESQYSISDLEIGPMTVLGIYRGKYKMDELNKKINRLKNLQNMSIEQQENNMLESDEEDSSHCEIVRNENVHFIDVISVIQELEVK